MYLVFLQTIGNFYFTHYSTVQILMNWSHFLQRWSTPLRGPLLSTIPELNCWSMNWVPYTTKQMWRFLNQSVWASITLTSTWLHLKSVEYLLEKIWPSATATLTNRWPTLFATTGLWRNTKGKHWIDATAECILRFNYTMYFGFQLHA
jgi:hypothetical protein